ncbi:MAG TPA: DUF1631 family protein [Gammaproteobacteria bacterium]|nr:DUF1631 family protein [Gammaproteobacteria bacterium]
MSNISDPGTPPEQVAAPEVVNQEYASKVIKNFIHSDGGGDKPAGAGAPATAGKNFHDRRDIIKALTSLQATYKPDYIAGQKVNINTDDFKHAVLNSMAKLSSTVNTKSLNAIDGRTIDFIEMLYAEFLRDDNMSDAIKTQLLQLQVTLIKVALLDSQFFHSNRHPARMVLDTIAHLGIGVEDKDNTLYKTISLIIEQLQTSFDQNTTSFNTALTALSRLTSIEKKKSDSTEAETQQEFLKEHARHVILTELKRYTKDKIVPPAINPLILKNWSNLMLQKYLQYGTDSKEWKECIDLLKQLVSSVQPVTNKIRLLMLKNSSADLIASVRNELYHTRQDRAGIDTALDALASIHKDILSSDNVEKISRDVIENKVPPEPHVDDHEEAQRQADEKIRVSKEQIARLPKDVRIGAWFEVFNGTDHAVRRLKLSMIMFDDAKLVFVDRVGNRVLEKQATELYEELTTNKSRVIADHSIFNHALGKVINSLASNTKPATQH